MTRVLLATLALGAMLAVCMPASAQRQIPIPSTQPAAYPIRADIVVKNDIVTFGDLVEGLAGPAATAPAFRAPELGQIGTIQASRVVEAAHAAGITVEPGLATQVVVTRAARRIAKADIEQALRKALSDSYGLTEIDVQLAGEPSSLSVWVEPESTGELAVSELVFDSKSQRVQAVVTLAGSRALTLKPIRASGQVVDSVEVPVLMRSVGRGETIRAADVVLERRPRLSLSGTGNIVDPSLVDGRVARTALRAGAVLREADTAKQEIVQKNSIVSVVYKIPGLALSMRARALEAGGLGDAVLVVNPQSKRQLQGTVVGPGQVSVSGPTPGPVASAQ
jgi:flagella basal body P-ring formation protein FlgA